MKNGEILTLFGLKIPHGLNRNSRADCSPESCTNKTTNERQEERQDDAGLLEEEGGGGEPSAEQLRGLQPMSVATTPLQSGRRRLDLREKKMDNKTAFYLGSSESAAEVRRTSSRRRADLA